MKIPSLKRVASVMNSLAFDVCGVRLFHRSVVGARLAAIRQLDAGAPSSALLGDAEDASLVVAHSTAPILKIDATAHVSQVGEGIVGRVAVDMVDVVLRPVAGHVEPCQAMESVEPPIEFGAKVSTIYRPANTIPNVESPIGPDKPSEDASFWLVVKKLAQPFGGKIVLSHEALQLLIGQRPASVRALSGLRYFSGGGV